MKRQPGFYWVKVAFSGDASWQVYYYNGFFFSSTHNSERYFDESFIEINENRIPAPDEVKGELLSNMAAIIDHGSKFTYNPEGNEIVIFRKGEPKIIAAHVSAGFSFDATQEPITISPLAQSALDLINATFPDALDSNELAIKDELERMGIYSKYHYSK